MRNPEMSTPKAYKLEVAYQYDEGSVPFMKKVAEAESESFQHCSKCGFPYVTNTHYRNRELCTYCSGYSPTVDEQKQEKRKEYMRHRTKERRNHNVMGCFQ
jgi:hypothetical protein